MTVALFEHGTRVALLAGAGGLAVAALLARRARWPRAFALCAGLALIALGALLAEQVVLLVARGAAPEQAEFNEHRWTLLAPWGTAGMAAGCVAALLIIALGWRASERISSPWRRALLLGLRTGGVAAALALFLEPALELRQVAREPNRVAVLVDVSQSMALRDGKKAPPRAEVARALLDRSAPAFERWRRDHIIDFYTFAATLDPSSEARAGAGEPIGPATLLREALEQTRARYDGADLAGVVVISDGTATGDFRDGAIDGPSREFLHSLDTRVHTAWIGDPGLKDVAIHRVLADEFAFARTVVKVDAVVRSTGYGPRRVPVSLSSEGKLIRKLWVDLPAGAGETTVSFEFTPPRVGKYVYEIATPVADDEAVDSNNQRAFVLRVIRDKIRVLQVAGQPTWDVRALRLMLKQNPNVDLISFFILRTNDDLQAVPPEEMSLIPFPTRELFAEELPSFDVIVLQNFDFQPYGIGVYLDNIRRYVEDGGGLIMLGGRLSFSSGLYDGTPVARALPVELLPSTLPEAQLLDTGEFVPRLTKAGRYHPIAALRYDDTDNEATWKSLPPLQGVNLLAGAAPDATVIAVHPTLKTRAGDPMPVMVAGEYEDGRTLAVTTDTLWHWGFVAAAAPGDDGRSYHKLWENAIRWVIQDPELRHLHVETDAPTYYAMQPVRVEVRLQNRDYSPRADGEVALRIEPVEGGDVVEAKAVTNAAGEGAHELAGLPPGVYRVEASATVGARRARAVDLFLVRPGSAELDEPAASPRALEAVSAATGGQFLGRVDALPADLDFEPPRVARVDRRAEVELWSRSWLLAAALLLLGLEWGLRQRTAGL